MNIIASKENKIIKEYNKLLNDKSYRNEVKLFVIESQKLVKEAFISDIDVKILLITRSHYEKNIEFFKAVECKTQIYLIEDNIENKLKSTKSNQGVYAICHKNTNALTLDNIKNAGKYLFLDDLQDTGNCGTIIRTANALGINGIILSNNNCDIYNVKVLRSSMGTVFKMKFLLSDGYTLLKDLKENGVQILSAVLDEDAYDIKQININDPLVLIIGNEGNGIRQECIDLSTDKVIINMKGNTESLNAAMAAGILMWEIMNK